MKICEKIYELSWEGRKVVMKINFHRNLPLTLNGSEKKKKENFSIPSLAQLVCEFNRLACLLPLKRFMIILQ